MCSKVLMLTSLLKSFMWYFYKSKIGCIQSECLLYNYAIIYGTSILKTKQVIVFIFLIILDQSVEKNSINIQNVRKNA